MRNATEIEKRLVANLASIKEDRDFIKGVFLYPILGEETAV